MVIEKTGAGIIRGVGPSGSAYAALTALDGTLTPLAGLPSSGAIFWVSANDSGEKLIAGQNRSSAYAAFVSPDGQLTPVADLPAGTVYSASINHRGNGIIGGTARPFPMRLLSLPMERQQQSPVCRRAQELSITSPLTKQAPDLSPAIQQEPHGAFVSPDGNLKSLKGLPGGPGFLDGAALYNSGDAIVGGTSANVPFAALVAPNGTLT